MAGVVGGAREAIQLCVADYITGEILLDRLILPKQKITQMTTFIHGISRFMLNNAVANGQALHGWEEARAELWKIIDSETILVGHALQNDLKVLRMIHTRVVDSEILAGNASESGGNGLKTLCQEWLGVQIRKKKKGAHNCMEDVLATREVVLWCLRERELFNKWAVEKREVERQRRLERERALEALKDAENPSESPS